MTKQDEDAPGGVADNRTAEQHGPAIPLPSSPPATVPTPSASPSCLVLEPSPSPLQARRCSWCRGPLGPTPGQLFCSKRCRQTAWRMRRRGVLIDGIDLVQATPGRFAYADPPYPGLSWKYYRRPEVDHAALIAGLEARRQAGELLGWALSTSSAALRDVLPLCPSFARVACWGKPHGVPPTSYGIHSVWEAVIVSGGRQRPPGVPDLLVALPARGGGELPGRKPLAFCGWLFRLLGMRPGDQLDDLYPGTGVVTRAWNAVSSPRRATSPVDERHRPSSPDDVAEVLDDGVELLTETP